MLFYDAISLIAQEKNLEAENVFTSLLKGAVDFFPNADTSPKITATFYKAQSRFYQAHMSSHKPLVLSETMRDGFLVINVEIPSSLLHCLKEMRVYFRTEEQAFYRSMRFLAAKEPQKNISLTIPTKTDSHDVIYFYLEFIGRYDRAFLSYGSVLEPKKATKKTAPLKFNEAEPQRGPLSQLKTTWPIFLSAIVVLGGTLAYGLVKVAR